MSSFCSHFLEDDVSKAWRRRRRKRTLVGGRGGCSLSVWRVAEIERETSGSEVMVRGRYKSPIFGSVALSARVTRPDYLRTTPVNG